MSGAPASIRSSLGHLQTTSCTLRAIKTNSSGVTSQAYGYFAVYRYSGSSWNKVSSSSSNQSSYTASWASDTYATKFWFGFCTDTTPSPDSQRTVISYEAPVVYDGTNGSDADSSYTIMRDCGYWKTGVTYYKAAATTAMNSSEYTKYENYQNMTVVDYVQYAGNTYLAKSTNTNQTPSSSSSYWQQASKNNTLTVNNLLANNAKLGEFSFSNNIFTSSNGKLSMNSSTGKLTCTDATITGNITATSGSFTGTVTATSGTFTNGVFTNCTTTNLTISSGTLKMSSFITSSLGAPSQAYAITTTTDITGSGFSILSATGSNDLIRATFGSKVVSVYNNSNSSIRALAAISIDGYYVSGRTTVTVPLYISAASDTDVAIFVDNGAFYGWNLPVLNISALINGVAFSCVCNVTSSGYTMALNQGKVGTMVFMSVSNGYTYTVRRDSCAWISSTGAYQSAGTSYTTYNDDARIFVRVAYNTWQEYYVG